MSVILSLFTLEAKLKRLMKKSVKSKRVFFGASCRRKETFSWALEKFQFAGISNKAADKKINSNIHSNWKQYDFFRFKKATNGTLVDTHINGELLLVHRIHFGEYSVSTLLARQGYFIGCLVHICGKKREWE